MGENNQNLERKIDIGNLLWRVCFAWRALLCAGIACAIIVGGIKYVLDVRSLRAIVSETESSLVELSEEELSEEELSEEELSQIEEVRELRNEVEDYKENLVESPLMEINPYQEHITEMWYVVKEDDEIESTSEYGSELAQIYSEYAVSIETLQKIAEEANLDGSIQSLATVVTTEKETGDRAFVIKVIHPNDEVRRQIVTSYETQMQEACVNQQEIVAHKLLCVGVYESVVSDFDLKSRQQTIRDTFANLKADLQEKEDALSVPQLGILDDAEEKTELTEEIVLDQVVTVNWLYVCAGFFLGVLLVCIWIGMQYLFSVRIQQGEDIEKIFNVRLLGNIQEIEQKKTFGNKLDVLLYKWKNRNALNYDETAMTARRIAQECKSRGFKEVCLTGSNYGKIEQSKLDALKVELQKEKITVREEKNLLDSFLEAGNDILDGGVVIVERTEKSIIKNVYDLLNCAKELRITIVGMVLMS